MKEIFSHKGTARRCHIYQTLKNAATKKHLSFHTPGHKVARWDVTELSYSDCLADPKGCILQARTDLEKIVGAKGSEILTDGSTSGVYALLYLWKEKGVKRIALSPFSHVSAFRACALFGLQPVLLEGQTALSQPTVAQMEQALSEADALFLTSPNYYGTIADLAAARALCDRQNKPLIVDGAHGGHLHGLPQYAGKYADGWVDGVHKSLPALTQGALVSVNNAALVEDFRRIVPLFRTTSPSYPVMASVEYALKYPRNLSLEKAAAAFAQRYGHRIYSGGDWTKLVVLFGAASCKAEKWLEERGIYAEFCDGKYLLFYLSPATKKREFAYLVKKLTEAFSLFPVEEEVAPVASPIITQQDAPAEWIEIDNAVGRVAASDFGLFPPCLPLCVKGQMIDGQTVEKMIRAKHTFGTKDGKIRVYQQGEK